jgi:hypothetical protein
LESRVRIAKLLKLNHEVMQVGDADVRQGVAGQSFGIWGVIVRDRVVLMAATSG